MNVPSSYRWTMLGVMTVCSLAFGIIFQSIPPILGILIDTFHISHTQAGALMSLFSLPAIFMALPGGILVDRYGARTVGSAGLLTMVLGATIVAMGGSYWVLAVGRLVAGLGAAVTLMVGPKVVTSWFRKQELGLSMGVLNTAMPLGTILSLNFMGVIAFRFGWQASIGVSFAVCTVALCLFLALYRNRNDAGQVVTESIRLLTALKEAGWAIWLVGAVWGLFGAAMISYFTYAPDYFVSQGEDIAKAGLLASYPMWGSIVLAAIVGLLIDRLGRKWLFVSVGCAGIAIILYLMPWFTSHDDAFAIILGVFVAIPPAAVFSSAGELLPERVTGLGFGIMSACHNIGILVGPLIAGRLRDVTGNYLWSFMAMATFAALGVIPMLILRSRLSKTKNHTSG
jgi:predicted MFS family arabinose efflux permease